MNHNKGLVNDPRPRADHPNPTHWDKIRKEALDRDQHKCQTCYSESDLEVHHRTYKRFGKEELEDLITLCKDCHYAITDSVRGRRSTSRKKLKLKDHNNIIVKFKIGNNELFEIELKDHGSGSLINAQRTTGRSSEPME